VLSEDILYNVWIVNKFKILFDETIIDKLSIRIENDENIDKPFTFLLGGISMFFETDQLPKNPDNFKIDNIESNYEKGSNKFYNKDKINLDVSWNYDENIWYNYIFRCIITDKNNDVVYVGRTSNNVYHIHDMTRREDELYSLISIKSVGFNQLVSVKEAIIKI
jgi:hypothetical protein